MSRNIKEVTVTGDKNQKKHEGSLTPRLPALTFNDGWLAAIDSIDSLMRPSRLSVKKGFYKDLIVVDSTLRKFRVIRAEKVGIRFDVGFRTLLRLLGGNPIWKMEITFDRPSSISLEEVKQLISDCFLKNEDYWDEMSQLEEFRDRIASADSVEEVFTSFREFHLI